VVRGAPLLPGDTTATPDEELGRWKESIPYRVDPEAQKLVLKRVESATAE
jgi:hypothetical protein